MMINIAMITLGLFLVMSSSLAAQDGTTSEKTHGYEVRFTPGPKSDPLEAPTVTIVHPGSDRTEAVALSNDVMSVDEVHYAGSRCIILGSLDSSGSRSLNVLDLARADVVASVWCVRPVVSPNKNSVAFEKWYPRFMPRGEIWPAVFVLTAEDAEAGPMQVYPEEETNPHGLSDDHHVVVSPIVWRAKGDALAFLDVYVSYGDWKPPYDLYCVLVRFKDGKPLRANRSLVDVNSFVRADADTDRIAFCAETLEFSDGKLKGKLYPQSYWGRSDFAFPLELIDREQTLSVKDIDDTIADDPKK